MFLDDSATVFSIRNRNLWMNTSTTQKIEIMQAFLAGCTIQSSAAADPMVTWQDVSGEPTWNWLAYNYRIKPRLWRRWVVEWLSRPGRTEHTVFADSEAAKEFHCKLLSKGRTARKFIVEEKVSD